VANMREVEVWRGQARIPGPLMDWVRERAKVSYRSLSQELVEVVREAKQAAEAKNVAQ
jgi:hypothetical protein